MHTPSLNANWDQALQAALAAADGASQILLNHFGRLRFVTEKEQAGLVSEADRDSEAFIVQYLRKEFPTHSFLGEEGGASGPTSVSKKTEAQGRWVIDPLDGTTNYVHQFPFFCVSIGLEVQGQIVVGVVDAPKMGLRYHATLGGGAYLNGERIHVSKRSSFSECLFATGFAYAHSNESLNEQLTLLAHIISHSRGIRRAGAAALDLCFVANGIFDAFWEKSLQPWDTAAGSLIVQEAGGVVTDLEGQSFTPYSKSILAGAPQVHGNLQALIHDIKSGKVPTLHC